MDKSEKKYLIGQILNSIFWVFLLTFSVIFIVHDGGIRSITSFANDCGIFPNPIHCKIVLAIDALAVLLVIAQILRPIITYKKLKTGKKDLEVYAENNHWKNIEISDTIRVGDSTPSKKYYYVIINFIKPAIIFSTKYCVKDDSYGKKLEKRYCFFSNPKGYILVHDKYFDNRFYLYYKD